MVLVGGGLQTKKKRLKDSEREREREVEMLAGELWGNEEGMNSFYSLGKFSCKHVFHAFIESPTYHIHHALYLCLRVHSTKGGGRGIPSGKK